MKIQEVSFNFFSQFNELKIYGLIKDKGIVLETYDMPELIKDRIALVKSLHKKYLEKSEIVYMSMDLDKLLSTNLKTKNPNSQIKTIQSIPIYLL